MSNLNKERIAFFPYFEIEASLATFFDKDRYDIIRIDMSDKRLLEDFGQEIYGDWCCPLKLIVAACEKAVVSKGVTKIIGMNVNQCSYPMVMGNLEQWIKKKFDYYPIQVDSLVFPLGFIAKIYQQLKRAMPDFDHTNWVYCIPVAAQRYNIASELTRIYYQNIPIVKNPKAVRKEFERVKERFVRARDLLESKSVLDEFKRRILNQAQNEKPAHRFLIAGDLTVLMVDFPILELEVFLAKYNIEMIKLNSSYNLRWYSKHARKAREVISKVFSNKYNKTKMGEDHALEAAMLYRILKGIEEEVDGIIYIKPNMCAPCDNLSYILKRENYFGLPVVEISYDEHSGINGIETRLEAFINIVGERKGKSGQNGGDGISGISGAKEEGVINI
jgi:hypothetical protein